MKESASVVCAARRLRMRAVVRPEPWSCCISTRKSVNQQIARVLLYSAQRSSHRTPQTQRSGEQVVVWCTNGDLRILILLDPLPYESSTTSSWRQASVSHSLWEFTPHGARLARALHRAISTVGCIFNAARVSVWRLLVRIDTLTHTGLILPSGVSYLVATDKTTMRSSIAKTLQLDQATLILRFRNVNVASWAAAWLPRRACSWI